MHPSLAIPMRSEYSLGRRKGLAIPGTLEEHLGAIKRLRQQSGPAFDRSCMTTMVQDRRKTLDQSKTIADHARNADLRAAARKVIPTIDDHPQAALRGPEDHELPERI